MFDVQFSSDDDFDDDLPKNMLVYKTDKTEKDLKEETKDDFDDIEPYDPRFNLLNYVDEFKMKKSDAGNKVFYTEDDLEIELLHKIGKGAFCVVYKAIGTYLDLNLSEDGVNPLKIPYAVKKFDRNSLKKK